MVRSRRPWTQAWLTESWPPKEVSVLIPKPANVTLRGKRVSADVVKDAEMGRCSWMTQVAQCPQGVLLRGRREGQSPRRRCDKGSRERSEDALLLV